MTTPSETRPVRVWDLPTRLFHWLLAAAVIGLVVSGKIGGNALVWHMRFGLLVFTLLGFRLLWGVVGGRWSRFASFLYAPGTVLRYLRGQHRPGDHFDVGHNPLGAFSVFALIAVLVVQVATGLVADDEIATTGPLNQYVASALGLSATAWHKGYGQWLLLALVATGLVADDEIATTGPLNKYVAGALGLSATAWHKGYGQWLLLALVALHVAAIVAYRLRGQNLVTPMITGDKALPPDVPPSIDSSTTRAVAVALVLAVGAVAAWIARQAG